MSKMSKPLRTQLLTATALCFANGVFAQDFERIAPKPATPPAQVREKPQPKASVADNTVLVKQLNGIVFVTEPQSVRREGAAAVSGIDASRIPELQNDAFYTRMSKYLGKPVSLGSVADLINDVVEYYAGKDRPFVSVTSPEQELTGGVLQVLVVEGKVGEVKIVGAKTFDEQIYRNAIGLKPGDSILKRNLDANISWLNRNPFRDVAVQLEPGRTFGSTDVTVRTLERAPVRLYAGYEDTGSSVTAKDRLFTGVNFGNVFGLDHQFSYQFSASPNFDTFQAHSATYVAPLPWHHLLTLFAGHAEIKGRVPAPFALQGRSTQVGLRYEVPLQSGSSGYSHSIIGGFDYKRTNNNLEFGLTNVSASNAEVFQGLLSYDASLRESTGTTSFTGTVFYSPGGVTGSNDDRSFQTLRAFAESRYTYARFQARRVTFLPQDFSWHLSLEGQISDGNLLGSEQLGLGGYASVRGYDEREANGDEGILVRNELRTPSFNVPSPFPAKQSQLQLLTFLDYGVVRNKQLLLAERRRTELSSVGLGMRYNIDTNVTLRFDYGWQLKDSGVVGSPKNSRPHFSLLVSY